MDELTIDGKTYVSSKRAAALTGYAKDYIGQLCREGRVEAKLVGRSWYVFEPSLKKHRFSDDEEAQEMPKAETAWGGDPIVEPAAKEEVSEIANIQAVWESPSYTPEEVPSLPELKEEIPVEEVPAAVEAPPEPLSDMQSAWQEWFAERTEAPTEPISHVAEPVEEEEPSYASIYEEKEEFVPIRRESVEPMRMVISDIQPVRAAEVTHKQVDSINTYQDVAAVPATSVRERRKKQSIRTYGPVKALLVAVILLSASIALVATGVIDFLHLGGLEATPLRFIEGSSVIQRQPI